jgi:hypothetical protein
MVNKVKSKTKPKGTFLAYENFFIWNRIKYKRIYQQYEQVFLSPVQNILELTLLPVIGKCTQLDFLTHTATQDSQFFMSSSWCEDILQ